MAFSETLRMEAALCIWEAMMEARSSFEDGSSETDWFRQMDALWAERSTVEMRHTAMDLADKALEVFDLIGGCEGAEALDLISYDWEFIPAFVARVDWTDCTADPAVIAASLKASRQGVAA